MKIQNAARFVGLFALALLLIAIAVSGLFMKSEPAIDTTYGQRFGRAAKSLNGTSVLAEMFHQAGAEIRTGYRLSPRLARSQTVVWAPNSFELPSKKELEFFEQHWLGLPDSQERTLIYIARDYEAAIEYYREQAEQGDSDVFVENTRRKARMQSDHAYMRSLTGRVTQCDWFSIDGRQHFFEVTPNSGTWWKELNMGGSTASRPSYAVSGVLKPPQSDSEAEFGYDSQVLLAADETPLILEVQDPHNWPYGRVLVVLNGSSLLNYPLVQHENRQLAAKLIESCNRPDLVTFLESGPGGIYVSNTDSNLYSGFGPLTVWPINAILLHLIAAGILFCIMVFPIFGRPRELVSDLPHDFGKHVDAVRRLLEVSKNRELAIEKVNHYRQLESDGLSPQPKKTISGNPFKVSEV